MDTLFGENRCKWNLPRPLKRDWVSSALSYYPNSTSAYLLYGIYSLVLTVAPAAFHLWVWLPQHLLWYENGFSGFGFLQVHECMWSVCSRETLWPGWPRPDGVFFSHESSQKAIGIVLCSPWKIALRSFPFCCSVLKNYEESFLRLKRLPAPEWDYFFFFFHLSILISLFLPHGVTSDLS